MILDKLTRETMELVDQIVRREHQEHESKCFLGCEYRGFETPCELYVVETIVRVLGPEVRGFAEHVVNLLEW